MVEISNAMSHTKVHQSNNIADMVYHGEIFLNGNAEWRY